MRLPRTRDRFNSDDLISLGEQDFLKQLNILLMTLLEVRTVLIRVTSRMLFHHILFLLETNLIPSDSVLVLGFVLIATNMIEDRSIPSTTGAADTERTLLSAGQ